MLTITVISPGNAGVSSAPGGIGYLSEMYDAADLRDDLSVRQLPDQWLLPSLKRLRRRYGGRLRTRWVNPYSLLGLCLVARFRIRSFPTVIIGSEVLDSLGNQSEFEDVVAAHLAGVHA